MKKILRWFTLVILAFAICSIFLACIGIGNNDDDGEEVTPTAISVSVDKTTVPTNVYAGDVRLTQISLQVKYDNGETLTVPLESEFITVKSAALLQQPGYHNIEVVYENCKCTFAILLLDPTDVQYTLKITGGMPVSVNGEQVSMSAFNGVYEGQFDRGTVVVIDWIEEEGKVFGHWKSGGSAVDNQRRTAITMNANYEYVAYASDILHTVTFVTYNQDVSIAQIKGKTIDSQSDITTEMSMDNYVFVGWTTQEITSSEATSGNIKDGLVQFPYAIEDDVTFYAVWTPIGFSYTPVSIEYAGKRVDGKEIVSYTGTLTELEIPSSSDGQDVIAISKDAFAQDNAKLLTKLTIPSTVISIEEGSFRNCSSLQSFYVDTASHVFSAVKGVLYQSEKSVLVAYPSGRVSAEYTVESTVTTICDYAFYNAVIGGIVMASDVSDIGDYAFSSRHISYLDFSQLKNTKIKNIGKEIFADCLINVLVDSTEQTQYSALLNDVSDKIITDKSNLTSVYTEEITDDLTLMFRIIVGKYFDKTTRTAEIVGVTRTAETVAVPETLFGKNNDYTVTSIGEYAFKDCIKLASVTLPSGLERVGDHAFDDTVWSQNLDNSSIVFNNTLYKYLGNASVYELADNITRIAEGAFNGNVDLTTVDITSNVVLERIDAFAFDGCKNLKSFASGTGLDTVLIKDALKKIAPYAFRNTAIKGIETHSGAQGSNGKLEEIGDYAFANTYYLERVNLGMNTVVAISSVAFNNCFALQEINVAENDYYLSISGILYNKQGEDYVLSLYPAGKMTEIFNPSKPDADTVLNVTSLGDYSLYYANIGALELEENVQATNTRAIYLPSSAYVRFLGKTTLHNATYTSVFANSGIGKFVFDTELSQEVISAFFGREEEYVNAYATTTTPCNFTVKDDNLYAIYTDGRVVIVGAERKSVNTEIVVSGDTYSDIIIGKYAFLGYNLKKLTVTNVSEFADNALMGANNLTDLVINGDDVSQVPTIYSGSLGKNFNYTLRITIYSDPEIENGYFDKWDGLVDTFSYADENGNARTGSVNVFYGKPYAVLTYLDENNVRRTSSIEFGNIDESAIIETGTKIQGYSVGKWYVVTKDNMLIDVADGFVITENMVLECQWIPDEYELVFVVQSNVTPNFDAQFIGENPDGTLSYAFTIEFGADYDFSVTDTMANAYNFNGWNLDGTNISLKGTWSTVLSGGEHILYPITSKKEYRIVYDTSDNDVIIAERNKVVYYGENYILDIPQKNGYEFIEWRLAKDDGSYVVMTNKNGVSLTEWRIVSDSDVVLYPGWKAKEIKVNLMLSENEKYGEATATFDSDDYTFTVSASDLPLELQSAYSEKVEFFAGWVDENEVLYADSNGKATKTWDKYEETTLYAVWPEFVSTTQELVDAVNNDRSISLVLTDDITITEPITGGYHGVLNGDGHTVTLIQTVTGNAQTVYSGIFDINEGTIKNIKIVIDLTVNLTDTFDGDAYVGGVCGINNGVAENLDAVLKVNATIGTLNGNVYMGGLFGISGKNVNNSTNILGKITVESFEVTMDNVVGKLYLGALSGVNYGIISFEKVEIKGFDVRYANSENNSFNGEIESVGSIIGANKFVVEGESTATVGTVSGSLTIYTQGADTYFASKDNCFGIGLSGNSDGVKFTAIIQS